MYDVSVVLNCHNEVSYITKTLSSLGRTIEYAQERGVKVELIIVLDNAEEGLYKLITSSKILKDVPSKLVCVNNGSLGASRNDGIKNALGTYIYTADGDDLVSANSVYQMYREAVQREQKGERVAVYSEYVFIFGNENFIYRMFDGEMYGAADYAYWNPFNSKLLIRRDILKKRPYKNVPSSSGFAFEDWEYNAYLRFANIHQVIAKEVVLYYRQHNNSIMHSSNYIRVIPDTPLFDPKEFLKREESEKSINNTDRLKSFNAPIEDVNLALLEDVRENGKIESLIREETLKQNISTLASIATNHWARELSTVFRSVGAVRYQNVLIVDSNNGLDDKLSKISENIDGTNAEQILVICLGNELQLSEKTKKSITKRSNIVLLPFDVLFGYMLEANKEQLLLRSLFSLHREPAVLYVDYKSGFCREFILKYKQSLKNYYRIEENFGEFFKNLRFELGEKPCREIIVGLYQRLGVTDCKEKSLVELALSLKKINKKDGGVFRVVAEGLKKWPFVFRVARKIYYCPLINRVVSKIKK